MTVPTAGTLTYIGARVPAAQTAGVQLGVYTDAGMRLTALNDTTLTAGVNEVSLVAPVALAAGDYWIAIGSPYWGYQIYEDTSVVAGACKRR